MYTPPIYAKPGSGASQSLAVGENVTASGSSSTAVGGFSQATGNSSIGIGYDARATANTNIGIGYGARVSGASGTGVGYAVSVTGGTAVAFGNSSNAAAAGAVALGQAATVAVTETGGIAIGQGATITAGATGGGQNIAIGQTANAGEYRATAIGYGAIATGISSTAIGRRALASATHSIALGRGAWANAANTVAIGFSGGDAPTDVYFESGHTHRYVDQDASTQNRTPSLIPIILHGFDAFDATGTPNNDVAGGDLRFAAGRGTGAGASGKVTIQTAPPVAGPNNVKNTLVNAAQFDANVTSQETRMLIWDITAAALVRVSRGASDSGGSGFRLLRVPN